MQKPKIGELPAEGEAVVLREAEDIEFLIVYELGAAVEPEVRLHVVQGFGKSDSFRWV